jgi:hypothetical protein
MKRSTDAERVGEEELVKKSWFNCSMRIWLIGDEVLLLKHQIHPGVSPCADLPLPTVEGLRIKSSMSSKHRSPLRVSRLLSFETHGYRGVRRTEKAPSNCRASIRLSCSPGHGAHAGGKS